MTRIKKRFISITLVLFMLSSCSYVAGEDSVFSNRDKDYLKASHIPPLKMPPGVSSQSFSAYYPVSYRHAEEREKEVDVTPPDLDL